MAPFRRPPKRPGQAGGGQPVLACAARAAPPAVPLALALALAGALAAGCDRDPAAAPVKGPPEAARSPPPPLAPPAAGHAAPEDLATLAPRQGLERGSVRGFVRYRGPPPESTRMFVLDAGYLEAHTTIVDPETRGLKNAAVWIEKAPRGGPAARLPPAVLDQVNFEFRPHVLAVRAGQEFRFRNSDAGTHNVQSFTPGAEFNMATLPGGVLEYRFRRPTGTCPVRVACDMHLWMLAWVYVFDHDAFAVTDPQGRFRIDGVPPGEWLLRAHHADGGLEAEAVVTVEPGAESQVEIVLAAPRAPR